MDYRYALSDLLSVLSIDTLPDKALDDVMIESLELDSRQVSAGALFIAYPGENSDGRDFIQQAEQAGATAVLYEGLHSGQAYSQDKLIAIPAIAVNDLQNKVGLLADYFYQQPSKDMQVFGVTGTNGKTTCCYLLTQALSVLDMNAAMIGTIGVGPLSALQSSGHTTPDPISIHRLLAQWKQQGITQVCMEVSSHALSQGRVSGVRFFCALFTNLSHDHLDYHGDMQQYAAAKQRLFADYPSELVITNADDDMGAGLIDIADSEFIASYGESGDVALQQADLSAQGMHLSIEASELEFTIDTPLIGQVNIPNLLLVVTTLLSLGTSVEQIQQIASQLKPAPGRMELYAKTGSASVVIDYAHTPDALEKAILSLNQHCDGQLWCVFGCGGDRDKGKRAVMGKIAAKLADYVVVTNDNPRSEKPEQIANEIVAEIDSGGYQIILDRAEAIQTAVQSAAENDWVLVAGKGHETTQEIAGEIYYFSDREQVAEALGVAA